MYGPKPQLFQCILLMSSTQLRKERERYKLIDQMSRCPHPYFIGPVDFSSTDSM